MATRKELNSRPASDFLKPENFITSFDATHVDICKDQYLKGLQYSQESSTIGISASGVWWAEGKDESFTDSFEVIGYHTGTADLLRGFLAGPAKLIIYRLSNGKVESTILKEAT